MTSSAKYKKTKYPELFHPSSEPYGLPYIKWIENWWRWAFSIPKDQNPITDTTGKYCEKGQGGPVWYLAGTTGNIRQAYRTCAMPQAKSILFPIIVSQFSLSEMPQMEIQELERYTAKDIDKTSFLEFIVDGVSLNELSKYRIKNRIHLDIVRDNIWGIKSGPTEAVSDGFWVFLKPLSKGKHIVKFHGIEPNFETRVTYRLSII
jgi:hypothetical protein